jgi:hypothetical protein
MLRRGESKWRRVFQGLKFVPGSATIWRHGLSTTSALAGHRTKIGHSLALHIDRSQRHRHRATGREGTAENVKRGIWGKWQDNLMVGPI